jgi:hypothetical protein
VAILRLVVIVLAVCAVSCSREAELPDDDQLQMFIEISSRCAFTERAYSRQKDVLIREMEDIEFPPNWDAIVDSLLARHGAESDLWYEIYREISDRSRRPLPPEEAGDVE